MTLLFIMLQLNDDLLLLVSLTADTAPGSGPMVEEEVEQDQGIHYRDDVGQPTQHHFHHLELNTLYPLYRCLQTSLAERESIFGII